MQTIVDHTNKHYPKRTLMICNFCISFNIINYFPSVKTQKKSLYFCGSRRSHDHFFYCIFFVVVVLLFKKTREIDTKQQQQKLKSPNLLSIFKVLI